MIKKILWAVLKYTSLVITGYMLVDGWVIKKAETVVGPVKKEIRAVRDADMEHLNKRFDRVEDKLDLLIKEQK
jgi:hypothetical protein